MRLAVALLLLTFALPIGSYAQWKIVAPNLVPIGTAGAMSYRDGRLWLAKGSVFRSDDKGATWAKVGNLVSANDIQFLDAMNGIAACINGTYATRDGGSTWRLLSAGAALSACFVGSPMVAVIAERTGLIKLTTDGGTSWNTTTQSPASFYITTLRDGSIMYFGGDQNGGFLHRSLDQGVTWQTSKGAIDFDSYTFGVDSCNLSRVVLANEDYVSPSDAYSQLFLSTDLGATWTNQISRTRPYFCGSVAVSRNAIYCQSSTDGIYRSIDHGVSWKSINGPSNIFDTRLISAITDNIIVATDSDGNVWRTTNSGGDSVAAKIGVTTQIAQLSFPKTVEPCTDVNIGLRLDGLCGRPRIDSVSFSGADSLNFIASIALQDSASVTFSPNGARKYFAFLHVFASGEEVVVPIDALGSAQPLVSITTSNISNDTIGGSIYVPIFANNQSFLGDLGFVVRYDTSMLVYVGTYRAGSTMDATTARAIGVAHVKFPQVTASLKGSLVGYSVFNIYPKDSSCTSVILDSFAITHNFEVCALASSPVISTVCSNVGCGTPLLSGFVRYGKIPSLRIIPNPSSKFASIHSDVDLGEVTIEVFDAVGTLVHRDQTSLSPLHSASINTEPYPAGAYMVRLSSSAGSYSLSLLHLH